jgi:antibiotic biosynthesis monooxygenase (ABM) superfamily enzyme
MNACQCQARKKRPKNMSDWTADGWINVTDELPKPFVIVVTKIEDSLGDREIRRGQYGLELWVDEKGKPLKETPTHWKPIQQ